MSKQKQMKLEYYQLGAKAIYLVRPIVLKHGEENIKDLSAVYRKFQDIEIKASDRVRVAREKLEYAKQLFEQMKEIAAKY